MPEQQVTPAPAPQEQPIKTVENTGTIVESSPTQAPDPLDQAVDHMINNASESPTVPPYGDEIVNSELDWTQETAPKPNVTSEGVLGEVPVEGEGNQQDLTDSMSKRITGIKQKHAEEIGHKEAEISRLQDLVTRFEAEAPQPLPQGLRDESSIASEMQQIQHQLAREQETMPPAKATLALMRANELNRELDYVRQMKYGHEQAKNTVENQRKQNDANVVAQYQFLSDPNSVGSKLFHDEVYPMLEKVVPNFKDNPNDIAVAAHITEGELAKRELASMRQQFAQGNTQTVPRNIPPIATDNAPQTAPPQNDTRERILQGVRSGNIGGGEAALALGLVDGYS